MVETVKSYFFGSEKLGTAKLGIRHSNNGRRLTFNLCKKAQVYFSMNEYEEILNKNISAIMVWSYLQ